MIHKLIGTVRGVVRKQRENRLIYKYADAQAEVVRASILRNFAELEIKRVDKYVEPFRWAALQQEIIDLAKFSEEQIDAASRYSSELTEVSK